MAACEGKDHLLQLASSLRTETHLLTIGNFWFLLSVSFYHGQRENSSARISATRERIQARENTTAVPSTRKSGTSRKLRESQVLNARKS